MPKPLRSNPVIALVLAWLIPGAGHVYLRRPIHGVVIFLTITATFWAGVGFGGVMTVDPRADRWWFMAETLTGINGLVGNARQKRVYADIAKDDPRLTRIDSSEKVQDVDIALAEKGVALVYPADVVARAYAGVAGLLNLLCIFDATTLAIMGAPPLTPPKRDDEPATVPEGQS